MTEKRKTAAGILILLLTALLAVQTCIPAATADDAEMLARLPGCWACPYEFPEDGEEPPEGDLAVLTLEEDGKMSLTCNGINGGPAYSCEGTWSAELVSGGMDRLTLRFESTDNPLYAGKEYNPECIYNIYTEGWTEDSTEITALLLEEESHSGVTPFEEMYGYDGAVLYSRKEPNMRVVNCSSYVSLRTKRSKTSARLMKVPLGALVLAFPESGEENGFLLCLYHNEYGFILKEYLEPAE